MTVPEAVQALALGLPAQLQTLTGVEAKKWNVCLIVAHDPIPGSHATNMGMMMNFDRETLADVMQAWLAHGRYGGTEMPPVQ